MAAGVKTCRFFVSAQAWRMGVLLSIDNLKMGNGKRFLKI